MDFTILYGMLFWSSIVLVILSMLACLIYTYEKHVGAKIKTNFFSFVALLCAFSIFSGSLTFLGMYYSKKFGLESEYKAALKIIIILIVLSYFIKNYRTQNKNK